MNPGMIYALLVVYIVLLITVNLIDLLCHKEQQIGRNLPLDFMIS